jgi:hypothetical protein
VKANGLWIAIAPAGLAVQCAAVAYTCIRLPHEYPPVLRVPEDIALVGYDDVPLASYVIPPLTTAHRPIYELGRQAALAVLGALSGAPLAARVVLPVPIVIRRSCGCSS